MHPWPVELDGFDGVTDVRRNGEESTARSESTCILYIVETPKSSEKEEKLAKKSGSEYIYMYMARRPCMHGALSCSTSNSPTRSAGDHATSR